LIGLKSPKPQGIVGLPFALRYRKMSYNFKDRQLSFIPYTEAELATRTIDPHEGEGFLMEATQNARKGEEGKPGFDGQPLDVRQWPEEDVKKGLVVHNVEAGSDAEREGLEAGDLIVAIVLSDEEAKAFG